jgi:signal transduction histidine kinase
LRTPLNAVIGYTDMLEEEFQDSGQADFIPDLHKIRDAGFHLLEMISDVLDLSKIEAGKMELELEDVDLAVLVAEVVAAVQLQIERNGNDLQVDCPDDVGLMRADPSKLRQIIFNLLSNAAKFTEAGAISLSVARESLVAKKGGARSDWIRLQVTDAGIGMTPDQVQRLFQAFTQADASATRKYGGTGLGLAISQRFCQMMGGEIQVESQLGRGSTFTVHLPVFVELRVEA